MSRVNTNQNAACLPSVQPADITLQQPVPTTTPLVEALGPEIIDIVHGFDFSKIDLRSMSTHDHLFTGLAPSSVALTREAVSSMDESVKIMMAVCTKLLAAIPAKDRTWHTVRAAMMQNPVTELVEAYMWKPGPLYRKAAWSDFAPRLISMKKIENWVRNFPDDMLWETGIDLGIVAAIADSIEAAVTPAGYIPGEIYEHRKRIIDITVLRYPDTEYSYFKLYRIYLNGIMASKRNVLTRTDTHGITGKYECQIFRPCTAVTDQLDEYTRKQCIETAEALFIPGYNFMPDDNIKETIDTTEVVP